MTAIMDPMATLQAMVVRLVQSAGVGGAGITAAIAVPHLSPGLMK